MKETFDAIADQKERLQKLIRHVAGSPEPVKAFELSNTDSGTELYYLHSVGFVDVDDVSDIVVATTAGRAFAGLRPDGVPDLPVEVAEVTGDIAESELAARYLEGKVAGADRYAVADASQAGQFHWLATVLAETANELRIGLHLPTVHVEGRVIHYNEDRSTGLAHAAALHIFFQDVYSRNVSAGWWTDIHNGGPKKRNVGELFMLMVTELAEAYEAYLTGAPDDKLPQYPGLGVEMGDLLIRIADFLGALFAGNVIEYDPGSHNPGAAMFSEVCQIARRYEAIRKTPEARGDPEVGEFLPASDASIMVDAKLAFNATRADHKIENRLKEGGKET